MEKRVILLTIILVWMGLCCGCGLVKADEKKLEDLSYTIEEDENLPEELKSQIEEKKEAHFKMTYETKEDLYIAMGYGQQETGGYCIQVKELYLTSNAVCFKTELMGPQKGEKVSNSPSYPHIVVKTKLRKEPVVFK